MDGAAVAVRRGRFIIRAQRGDRGRAFIEAGEVKNPRAFGAPACDKMFLRFRRPRKADSQTIYLRADEALDIVWVLTTALMAKNP